MDEYKEPVINAKVFANEFQELIKSFRPPVKDSNTRLNYKIAMCNENIIGFLVRVKNSMNRGRCDIKTFKEQVIKINTSKLLEIEIWWYLKTCDIMQGEDFYLMFDSNDCRYISEYFSKCLCKSIFLESIHSPFRKNMNSDLTGLILNYKENCDFKGGESHMYQYLLDCISSYNNVDNKQDVSSTDSVVEILKMTSAKDSVKKLFLLNIIQIFLQGESMGLGAIMQKIEHYIRNENLVVKKNLKIFELLEPEDITSYFKQIFIESSKPMNWHNLFYLLSCMTSYYEDNLKHLKTLILFLLDNALENLNTNSLLYVFVLARHCSFPEVSSFPSYLNWFGSTFSSESSRPINTKEKAVFFINFLNETVMYDSPYYLKVHINRAPYLPLECQSLLSDYVKLVKTRLIDLNESSELGLFDNVSTKASAEFDVETVLNIFANTNEVPNCVLQASLFCRLYYEKKFLVTLLSRYEGKNSVRHRLITKLQSLGKIPNSLFLNYKQLI